MSLENHKKICGTCKFYTKYEFGNFYVCDNKRFELLAKFASEDKDFNFGCICHEERNKTSIIAPGIWTLINANGSQVMKCSWSTDEIIKNCHDVIVQLKDSINKCWSIDEIMNQIDKTPVSYNIRRLLKVGFIQEELVKLGFEIDRIDLTTCNFSRVGNTEDKRPVYLQVYFTTKKIHLLGSHNYNYSEYNLLINKVKELINE